MEYHENQFYVFQIFFLLTPYKQLITVLPPDLIINNYAFFSTECSYEFIMIIRINSNDFLKQQ
jgi:hypothetical protein